MNRLVICALLFCAGPTFGSTWYTSTVKTVYPQSNGAFVIIFDTPSSDCSRTDKYHFVAANNYGVTQEGVESMLSVVLTAVSLGKAVTVYFDETSGGCFINRLSFSA